jgi:uncharacterized protein YutE (UPF0331/DUF86 family)
VFKILGQNGVLPEELVARLGEVARQRNLLVHLYMEVDDRAISLFCWVDAGCLRVWSAS